MVTKNLVPHFLCCFINLILDFGFGVCSFEVCDHSHNLCVWLQLLPQVALLLQEIKHDSV